MTPEELPGPLGQGIPAFGDSIGGMFIAGGISAALLHRERTGERRDFVGECDGRQQRRAVGFAVHGREAAHRLGHRREARACCVGAGLAEARDAQHDEPRIASMEDVGSETEPLEGAGPAVLDEDIGTVAKAQHHVEVRGGLEVEFDTTLVATDQLPHVTVAAFGGHPAHPAHAVAAGRFDLHDVGTEVGEVAGRSGTGEHRRHIDDPQSVECSRHGCSLTTGRNGPMFDLRLSQTVL